MVRRSLLGGTAALALVLGIAAVVGGGFPTLTRETQWAIGIYAGPSPFDLGPPAAEPNPVLSAAQVTDVTARFVADPFMLRQGTTWFMFFEVLNAATDQGDIAVASSADARRWRYGRIVLDEPFHLSYPYVFAWEDSYYLIPESAQARAVRLYRADEFPSRWTLVQTLLTGAAFTDPSLIRHEGRWWLFAATEPATNGTLNLYYADRLDGPWQAHPANPIVHDDPHRARPAGRVVAIGDRLFRFAQDDAPRYGLAVWALEITTMTPTAYAEQPVGTQPILSAGDQTWNRRGMHHIDPHELAAQQWIAAVDGSRKAWALRFWNW